MIPFIHFWESAGRQLRSPAGRWGRLAGRLMAVANRQPYRAAIDALGVGPADTVLELGFGPGEGIKVLAALAPRGLVLGVDGSPEMLAQASRANRLAIAGGRVRLDFGRFDALPWPAESVDRILAVNVVYFFGAAGSEMREALRVLRPGGIMVIYATDRATMSRWKFAGLATHRHFDADELLALADDGGFPVDAVSTIPIRVAPGMTGLIAVFRKR
jgi:SAM-dependent methyltransferase